jgi:SAM-dependent methyltransferase
MDLKPEFITVSNRDFLWVQISELPYFRGLLRAVESRFYRDIPLQQPVLDLGCGDGHFASRTFDQPIAVGIDPWAGPVRLAAGSGAYDEVIHGSGDQMPFSDGFFNTCISNSVLEHIPDLDPVLAETARVLKPGSLFVFCVPNHQFLSNLSVSNFFDRIGLRFLGDLYRGFFNRISRHHHCDSPEVWQARLEKAGFRIERCWHYFSPKALHTLEWGHYFGLPSLVSHFLFRKWILAPVPWNLALIKRMIQSCYTEAAEHPRGAYTFYIARRV